MKNENFRVVLKKGKQVKTHRLLIKAKKDFI